MYMKLGPLAVYSGKKIKFKKWIKDIDMRPDTIKILEENTGRSLFELNYINVFYPTLRVMKIRTKINK